MNNADDWHVDDDLLAAYATGGLAPDRAWSVEAHLPGCARCRAVATRHVDPVRLGRLRAELVAAVDVRHRPGEVLLARLGVPEHVARLLVATPALRLSWLTAVVGLLASAVLAAYVWDGPRADLLFLAVAPVLPVLGVAAAFGPGVDPAYELALTAPINGFRLLLLRTTAVLVSTVAVAAVAAWALPGPVPRALGWLLPALALTVGTLALSSVIPPRVAGAVVGVAWLWWVTTVAAPLFTGPVQGGFALLTALAALVVYLRRARFDTGSTARAIPDPEATP
ncbi:zf-HC2 domain-containing protein [Longispora sp. K20-0274]|uniref:zf-HC2 domain-containing protein n=1 Tax=Longispora sp. K20-0274 TaxID=3088255 RepID=UPI00399C358E